MPTPQGTHRRSSWARIAHGANRVLGAASDRLPHRTPAGPPTFVVGPPRSGSTYLSQLLAANFDIGYLTNAHCALYGAAHLVERIQPPDPEPSFTSSYGRTSKLWGQSECGGFWYRFFPKRPQVAGVDALAAGDVERLVRSVDRLSAVSGRPFLFKNLVNSLRIPALRRAFPDAIWLVMHRAMADTASSILRARLDETGSYENWWSVEPAEMAELVTKDAAEQAVGQARAIWCVIDRDTSASDRLLDISYDRAVADPREVVDEVDTFMRDHGVDWVRRDVGCYPTATPRSSPSLPPELRHSVECLAGRPGSRHQPAVDSTDGECQ